MDLVYEAVANLHHSAGWVNVELVCEAVQELLEEDEVIECINNWVTLGIFIVRLHGSTWHVKFTVVPKCTLK